MTTTTHPTKTAKPATERQLKFIKALVADRTQALARRGVTLTEAQLLRLSTVGASATIAKLKTLALDTKPAASVAPVRSVHPGIVPGVYAIDGKICKVIPSQSEPGRLYVATLQSAPAGQSSSFITRGQRHLLFKLTPAHKLTAHQASEYGSVFGRCACCGKLLTVPESVERGIGPVCWDKHFA